MATKNKRDTIKFRKYIEKTKEIILDLVYQEKFLARRSIQIILEENCNIWHTITWNAINELVNEKKIRMAKYPPRSSRGVDSPVWVYRTDMRINEIKDEISNNYMPLYRKFVTISREMGYYAQNIVEDALKKAKFNIISKEDCTRYFKGELFPGRKKLDFIAYRDGVFYGIEVKNHISYPDLNKDILKPKKIADFHGVQFVMISRRLGYLSHEVFKNKGLYVEFENLIFDPQYSSLAEKINEVFYYPVLCTKKPWGKLINKLKEIPIHHDKHFYRIGRI